MCQRRACGLPGFQTCDIQVHEGINSRQRGEELNQHAFCLFELLNIYPFITGMCLCDISGAKHHAWRSALRQDRGITKVVYTQRTRLPNTPHKSSDKWQARVRLQRQTRSEFASFNLGLELFCAASKGFRAQRMIQFHPGACDGQQS